MKLALPGAVLKKVERDKRGGKLHFSAEWTTKLQQQMLWGPPDSKDTSTTKEGSLVDAQIAISPKQKDLFNKGEFVAACTTVGPFTIVRRELKGSKDKGFRHELHFVAKFIDKGVAAVAETWLMTVGDGPGRLIIAGTYSERQAGGEGDGDGDGDEDGEGGEE